MNFYYVYYTKFNIFEKGGKRTRQQVLKRDQPGRALYMTLTASLSCYLNGNLKFLFNLPAIFRKQLCFKKYANKILFAILNNYVTLNYQIGFLYEFDGPLNLLAAVRWWYSSRNML